MITRRFTLEVTVPDGVSAQTVADALNMTLDEDAPASPWWGDWQVGAVTPAVVPYCKCCVHNECECEGDFIMYQKDTS